MRAAPIITILACALFLWTAGRSYESGTEVRAYAASLVLWFKGLPELWTLEASTDLTNWFTVVRSGEVPPREFSMTLTNESQAQFYRMRISDPTQP